MQGTFDELDAIAADVSIPSRAESRESIRLAVMRVAGEHKGLVHASWVRPLLPPTVTPHQIGAFICAQVRLGNLVPTGRYLPNGDGTSRNRTKRSEVRRLARPIPPENRG